MALGANRMLFRIRKLVGAFWLSKSWFVRQIGNWQETAFAEIIGDVPERDLNEAGRAADAARDVTEQ